MHIKITGGAVVAKPSSLDAAAVTAERTTRVRRSSEEGQRVDRVGRVGYEIWHLGARDVKSEVTWLARIHPSMGLEITGRARGHVKRLSVR